MNLFDEHLFDEEMKLFKFTNEKEKKGNEPSKTSNQTQEMIFPNQNFLETDNNFDSQFSININNNNDNKPISEKTNEQIIENIKSKNKQQINIPNQTNMQQNISISPQNLMETQSFQPKFQFTNNYNLISTPTPPIKNISNNTIAKKPLQNMPFIQQPTIPNTNFMPINRNQNVNFSSFPLPNQKKEAVTQNKKRSNYRATNTSMKTQKNDITNNINFIRPPQNPDFSKNINNSPPMNNPFFTQNAPPGKDNISFTRTIDFSLSNYFINNTTDDESLFKDALENVNLRFNPVKLGFIPSSFWAEGDMTFNEIVKSFFQRKNNSKCRFPHKLYNALILTQTDPSLFPIIGVYWVDRTSILIKRKTFARLLGIKSIEGSLFHQQGNFPSHGFAEIDPKIVKMKFPNFDFSVNRLITHTTGVFVYGCTEADIDACKWNSANK